jgi:hypothetical protein
MRLKELQIKEAATAGATAAGNIASIANPHVTNPSRHSVAYTGTPGVSGKGPVKQYVAKKQKPTDNALDGDKLLMSSKTPQMIRRQIEEGSLYEGWPIVAGLAALAGAGWAGYKKLKGAADDTVKKVADRRSKTDQRIAQALGTPTPKKKTEEGLRIEPRGEAGKANAFKRMMANASKNKETRAINTEKSKRQTAQAAGYRAIVGGKDISQIAKG